MRQIEDLKFRLWHTERKHWIAIGMTIVDFQKDASVSLELPLLTCESGVIIQQFTGLKDSNGVDIYEGDTILETWEENQPYGYCPDEWYNQTSKFVVEYKAPSFNFPKRYGDQRSIENYELKVIGNIFEDKNG